MSIKGNMVIGPTLIPDFNQTDSNAPDYIKNKPDMESYLEKSGGTMTGPLNVLTPTEGRNAANKAYVDGKDALYSGVLVSGAWNEYQQTVAAESSTADKAKTAIWVAPDPEDTDGYNAYLECGVRAVNQQDGFVTFQAEDAPEVDIPVDIFVRKLVTG